MTCPTETPESAELLLAYISRKLDARSRATLDEHIDTCPACREIAGGQKFVWQALDDWEAPPASADFDRRLYRRIEEERSWWDRLAGPWRPMLFRRALPIAAAAVLVV